MANKSQKRILIVGAGEAGIMALDEIQHHSELNSEIIGFIDDDPEKLGKYLKNVKVLGNREKLPEIIYENDIHEVLIAMPSAEGGVIRSTINVCQNCKTDFKIVPCLWEIINGNFNINQIRQVNENDLLGRETAEIDKKDIIDIIKGKKVMVTGGGGSIGSELCRQVARNKPESIIIFSRGENSLYNIGVELNHYFPELSIDLVVGNVEDSNKVEHCIRKNKPDIIFHAAAHKHVPFMEKDPDEAIKTNVFGTKNLAESAIKWGVEKFVLISTDKAINPTSVMGASKRIAEMIIQHFSDMQNQTKFMAVRFGNVIGSRGSVVPFFKKQIEYGGPVTVTHPDVLRYFMTIPEAVQLIQQAVTIGNGGEVFVLDMGDPIRIVDLARNLIVLSGFIPEQDIKIIFTGLRPGEKLFEEPLSKREDVSATKKDKIYISNLMKVNDNFTKDLDELQQIIYIDDTDSLIRKLMEIVPTYKPNREAKKINKLWMCFD
ncbi:MAG: nucleoside-diphosphate sugar epimerase/dehydratase [Candidatus Methanoperedens sp.]|nr:nucleoside-diphosphate sugar epimerase/dehydratase [Candidatus Methanoperedens sp.]